jgi:hypothetical protein
MSHIVDLAQSAEALHLQRALAAVRTSHPPLISCHRCHNCDASLPAGVLFCDTDCRDDYQRRMHLQAGR